MEKYSRNNEIIDGTLDDNQIMMHTGKGKYFGLNPVGKRIWELIEQPKTFDELTAILFSEYDVPKEQCRQEVRNFLGKAIHCNIIRQDEADS